MATIGDVRDAVYAHFLAEAGMHAVFADLSLAQLSATPPGRLSLGAEEAPQPEDDALWLRLVLRHTGRVQETMGGIGRRRIRASASILAGAFVPLRTPGGPAWRGDQAIEAFMAIFSARTLRTPGGARVLTYASVPRDQAPEGPWLPVQVETPLSYDERE